MKFIFSKRQRITSTSAFDPKIMLKAVCVTWIITKLICYRLWLADRLFPLVPVNEAVSILPDFFHSGLFIISLICMAGMLFFQTRKLAAILLISELLSCALDQNRWQPWEYQFLFMLATFVFIKDEKYCRFSWQLIIAGLFFFSGLGKFNSAFIHDTWQNLILYRWLGLTNHSILLVRAGYLLPMVEMMAAICLFINPFKTFAVAILTGMHLMILLMLGPIGLNINAVVWPWNILMILLLLTLFLRTRFEYSFLFSMKPFTWIVLTCWWILPWLQLAGYWDKYLSAVLYSGGIAQLYICTDNTTAKKEMAVYMDKQFGVIPCAPVLSVYKWGVSEMRTAPYPEPRVFHAIIKAWKKRYPDSTDRFYLYKPGFAYRVTEIK